MLSHDFQPASTLSGWRPGGFAGPAADAPGAVATGLLWGAGWVRETPRIEAAPRQPLLAEGWLEGDLPPLPPRELAVAGLAQLRHAAAVMGQLDLALARELRAFCALGGVKQAGHCRPQDFCLERLGFSWSLAQELMLLERRLQELPATRAALVTGLLSRSKVRELIRVATPETDQAWAAFARGRSVRQLKAAILAWKRRADPAAPQEDPSEEPDAAEVRWRCTQVEAGIWRGWGRSMMRDLLGHSPSDAQMVEALAAETLTACDAPGEADADDAPSASAAAAGSSLRRRRRRAPRLKGKALRRHARRLRALEAPPVPGIPSSDEASSPDAWQRLAVLRDIQRLRNGLAFERWRVLDIYLARDLHRVLGITRHQFCEYVLGLAPKDVEQGLRLQSSLMMLPALAAAWREGLLAEREVRILARIATRQTEEAWIAHAARCARARLEEEVNWHLAVRAVLPWPAYLQGTGGLPDDAPISKTRFSLDWRTLFGVRARTARAATESGESGESGEDDAAAELDAPWNRPDARPRHVTMIVPAPASVAMLWRQALGAVRQRLPCASDGECVHQMLVEFAHAHQGEQAEARLAEHAILERDGWCCSMDLCRSRQHLHVHHVVFRSRGGTDDADNLITLCEGCHRLLHEGFVALHGRAPEHLTLAIAPAPEPGGAPRELWIGGLRQ